MTEPLDAAPPRPGAALVRAELAARTSYGRLLALLAAGTHDIAGAEDALADAFERALRTWPEQGVPDRPDAWLLTVARNRQRDHWRSAAATRTTILDPEADAPHAPRRGRPRRRARPPPRADARVRPPRHRPHRPHPAHAQHRARLHRRAGRPQLRRPHPHDGHPAGARQAADPRQPHPLPPPRPLTPARAHGCRARGGLRRLRHRVGDRPRRARPATRRPCTSPRCSPSSSPARPRGARPGRPRRAVGRPASGPARRRRTLRAARLAGPRALGCRPHRPRARAPPRRAPRPGRRPLPARGGRPGGALRATRDRAHRLAHPARAAPLARRRRPEPGQRHGAGGGHRGGGGTGIRAGAARRGCRSHGALPARLGHPRRAVVPPRSRRRGRHRLRPRHRADPRDRPSVDTSRAAGPRCSSGHRGPRRRSFDSRGRVVPPGPHDRRRPPRLATCRHPPSPSLRATSSS